MNPLEFVRQCPPFDRLDEVALQSLERKLEITFFPKGTKVLQQGGPKAAFLYLIRKGEARLVQNGQTVDHLEAGELFGYPSLLSDAAPSADVLVEEEVLAYCWNAATFHKLLEQAEFAQFFTQGLAQRLKRSATPAKSNRPLNFDLSLSIAHLVSRPPVFIEPQATVGQAAQTMRQQQISSVLVQGPSLGILTDRDLRNKVLAEGKGPETPISAVMSAPIKQLPASTPLFEALAYMVQHKIHHLPVEENGQVLGVITDTVFMQQQSKSPLQLVRRLERTQDLTQLAGYSQELLEVTHGLLAGGLGPTEVGRSVSSLNDQLVRVLCSLAEQTLGPPPTPYAWMVFGSEGRMEQTLLTDQDNALAYQASPEATSYFARFAQWVVDGLVQAGFPPCPGGYMATNWNKSLAEWEVLFRHWTQQPQPQELLEAQIFFDFRSVAGELSLHPLQEAIRTSGQQRIFLAQLAKASLQFRPPLGLFRRIKAEAAGVDLKKGGLAPIVAMARLYALESGSAPKSTLERLQGAQKAGQLSLEGAETLQEAFVFLQRLRLRHQLAQIQQGETHSNLVPLEALSALEHRHLKEALVIIRTLQEAVSSRYQVGQLG